MLVSEVANRRLYSQNITHHRSKQPGEAVAWMGAMQAQDFTSARWAVGLRCGIAKDHQIQKAVAERSIVRTWLMRGTLHIASARDIHWMMALLAPRLIAGSASRSRQLELDGDIFMQSFNILTKVLADGKAATRAEMMAALEAAGISTAGQRGYHILAHAALEGILCFGPQQGKQQTFVLLDDWIPHSRHLEREQALAELARRYFSSHGPATLADFTWWSGLTAMDAREALDSTKNQLRSEAIDNNVYWLSNDPVTSSNSTNSVHLLPAFDEYYLGYTDRSAVLDARFDRQLVSSNGIFRPMLVIDGQVAGVWKREMSKQSVTITLSPFFALNQNEKQAVSLALERYQDYLGLPVILI
jgi:hypothetical protein